MAGAARTQQVGANGSDQNAVLLQLNAEAFGEANQRKLAGAVRG
ncbi:hypothetical protein [Hymenobacter qilianensis]